MSMYCASSKCFTGINLFNNYQGNAVLTFIIGKRNRGIELHDLHKIAQLVMGRSRTYTNTV